MKKVTLCIGAFLVLFLVIGVYTAQAVGDLRAFDGKWLQMTIKEQKGFVFATGHDSTDAPQKWGGRTHQVYACIDVRDSLVDYDYAFLRFYDNDGKAMGYGSLNWESGTNLDFVNNFAFYLATDVTYVPGTDGKPTQDSLYDLRVNATASIKGTGIEKVKIQSFTGEGWTEIPTTTETTGNYAIFAVSLKGKPATENKIPPFTITPACGAMVWN